MLVPENADCLGVVLASRIQSAHANFEVTLPSECSGKTRSVPGCMEETDGFPVVAERLLPDRAPLQTAGERQFRFGPVHPQSAKASLQGRRFLKRVDRLLKL